MGEQLTVLERKELARLEGVVDANMTAFREVGLALMDIRDRRLYRETHGSFEVYCRERFAYGRRHGDRLIAFVKVLANFGEDGPKTERQTRELAGAPPDVQQQVWEQAKETGNMSAKALRDLLASMPDEDQAEFIQKADQDAMNLPDTPRRQRPRSAARVEQIEHLAGRLRKLHAGLPDVADDADQAIDSYLATIHRSAED